MAKILIVEDNELNLKLLQELLEHLGYEVLAATDGAEGLRLAREIHPALVLMDLQIPLLDGLSVTRSLRQDPATRGTPVVALTGCAMAEDREAALAAGCNGFLTKPIRLTVLLETVEKYV